VWVIVSCAAFALPAWAAWRLIEMNQQEQRVLGDRQRRQAGDRGWA
jgi:hypothetical protein